jgi:PAS domain S-box-containing protein
MIGTFQRLLELTGDGVYRYTFEEGRILFANRGLVRILGLDCDPEQLVGKLLRDVLVYTEREGTVRLALAQHGEIRGFEYHFRTLGGEDRWVLHDSRIVRDPASGQQIVEAIVKDVTERRRLQEETAKAQRLESLGVLAGGIAHDFNNILTVVLGNVSLARMGLPDDHPAVARLADAGTAVGRARDLTQQLLTFAKGGAPVRCVGPVDEVVRSSSTLALAGSSADCTLEIAPDLWPAEIDEGQIAQVVSNLVINADQAMPAGGRIRVLAANVRVSGGLPHPMPSGRYVRVSVRDDGMGIPANHLSRIFDPYFTTKQKGSGLGLSVCYSIVKNHGGGMFVESQLGLGACFHVYLPAADDVASTPPEGVPRSVRGAGRVLVMDDDPLVRGVLAAMLTELGFQAVFARDGAEAVVAYADAARRGHPFAAAILDLTVRGGVGGLEAVRRLLALDPGARALVSSGYSNDPVLSDHRAHGFRGVVRKPYRVEELSAALHQVLDEPRP